MTKGRKEAKHKRKMEKENKKEMSPYSVRTVHKYCVQQLRLLEQHSALGTK